jgi:hypothetical protein
MGSWAFRACFVTVLAAGCAASNPVDPVGEVSSPLAQRQALYVDGELVGWVSAADEAGGHARLAIDAATSLGHPLKEWIESSLGMEYQRKSGSLRAGGFNGTMRRRDFVDARITGITFPDADDVANGANGANGANANGKRATLIVHLDARLSGVRVVPGAVPAAPPVGAGLPRVTGVSCACNAIGIRDLTIGRGGASAVVAVSSSPNDPQGDHPTLEFSAADPKELTVDLQFDDHETHMTLVDVTTLGAVAGAIQQPDGGIARELRIRATLPSGPNNPNGVP